MRTRVISGLPLKIMSTLPNHERRKDAGAPSQRTIRVCANHGANLLHGSLSKPTLRLTPGQPALRQRAKCRSSSTPSETLRERNSLVKGTVRGLAASTFSHQSTPIYSIPSSLVPVPLSFRVATESCPGEDKTASVSLRA